MKDLGQQGDSGDDHFDGEASFPDPAPSKWPLIAAARRGERAAFDELFAKCRDYLLAVANGRLGRSLRAKVAPSSVVQVTLSQAHQHFERFRGDSREELLRWLTAILAKNIKSAKRRFRARKRDARLEIRVEDASAMNLGWSLTEEDNPQLKAAALEEVEQLAQAMLRLSDNHRAVINLRTFQDRSFADVGAAIGKSEEAARSLWVRAVDQLAKLLATSNGAG